MGHTQASDCNHSHQKGSGRQALSHTADADFVGSHPTDIDCDVNVTDRPVNQGTSGVQGARGVTTSFTAATSGHPDPIVRHCQSVKYNANPTCGRLSNARKETI